MVSQEWKERNLPLKSVQKDLPRLSETDGPVEAYQGTMAKIYNFFLNVIFR